ncbi:MAG: hypothetical protein JNK58_04285 [Phycisphaerae bacterium]|nr:hypothetical protein [Phycisphaerae bacterium]
MPLLSFYKPPLYFFSRFAPWCIPAAIGLFRVFAHPAADERQRMHERFLASWFLVGLAIFAIAPHQRADLLLPLIPAAAMLAGRELARWLDARPPAWPMKAFVACAAIATVLVAVDRHIVKRQDPIVQRTAEWKECARRIEALPGHPPLMDVGAPMALQMFLNLHQPRVSMESARIALQDDAPVVVAYSEPADERAPPLAREIATLPDPVRPKESRTRIVTNAPAPGK